MRSHLSFCERTGPEGTSVLLLNGINIQDKKCNNKHIRRIFQDKKRFSPRGTFYWRSRLEDINWEKAWLLPYKYCIHNKVKETHFKILHKIYPVNSFISKFMDVDSSCVFCGHADLIHLFFECNVTMQFWSELGSHVFTHVNMLYCFSLKEVICYYENNFLIEFNLPYKSLALVKNTKNTQFLDN